MSGRNSAPGLARVPTRRGSAAEVGAIIRKQPGRAYDEMRAGLTTAYSWPEYRVMPQGYLPLAVGLLRLGPRIGRGAHAAAVLAQLRRTYDADPNLAALQGPAAGPPP